MSALRARNELTLGYVAASERRTRSPAQAVLRSRQAEADSRFSGDPSVPVSIRTCRPAARTAACWVSSLMVRVSQAAAPQVPLALASAQAHGAAPSAVQAQVQPAESAV